MPSLILIDINNIRNHIVPPDEQLIDMVGHPYVIYSRSELGFYPSTFVCSYFPPKIHFYCFLNSVALWHGPMVDTERKYLRFRSANCWKMHFYWIFVGILEFYGEFLRKVDWREIHTTFFMQECL